MEIDVDGYKYYLHHDLWLKQQKWGKELERKFWNRILQMVSGGNNQEVIGADDLGE